MDRTGGIPNFASYRTVSEAAEFLGVSSATLRNWDRAGKLKPRRHPQNGYRIYLHEDLQAVLRSASRIDDASVPLPDWSEIADTEHFVQFYENDEYLLNSLSGFIGSALTAGEAAIVIATPEHRQALREKLMACGVDIAMTPLTGSVAAVRRLRAAPSDNPARKT